MLNLRINHFLKMKNPKGLSEIEVVKIREKFGENVLQMKEGDPWFFILLRQLKSPLIYILIVIAGFSAFFQKFTDVLMIGCVVVLNSIMGFFQEYKAQKTLVALRKILRPTAFVFRDGQLKEIETSQIVPGDIIKLGSGDKISADGILKEATDLLINEAILTGEQEAVQKFAKEGENEVFMGTTVLAGHAVMVATKTGAATEIGKIEKSLAEIKEEKTPIQQKLEAFAKDLSKLVLAICFLIFLVGLAYGTNFFEILRFSVILVIAAIPEGMPVAITIILALGMKKILKKNGLVKKMISIETLGASSVICTDKTGTLTEGNMRVVKTDYSDSKTALQAFLITNSRRTNIDIALWNFAKSQLPLREIEEELEIIYEEPFNSQKKYVMVVCKIKDEEKSFLIGAPEIVLNFCNNPAHQKKEIIKKIDEWADEGLKIIGIACKKTGRLREKKGYTWIGLAGISDPIRPEAKDAIAKARDAGIDVKIVTGDYRKTAERIAINLGFNLTPESVMEGGELENISEGELAERIKNISLFVRVTPTQKQKIISTLQRNGEVVAMTGDGVNDAPALKKADIGVVLGAGSDVAKEAGDLILLDNNFKTIVSAIEEGRTIFANIKKVVAYVLSNSFVEIFLIFGSILLKLPYPLTIAQILWLHLICDGPPDIMLCFEQKERNVMKEKPQNLQRESILSNPIKFLIVSISLAVGLVCLVSFWLCLEKKNNLDFARTLVFATVAAVDLIYVFSFRDFKESIFKFSFRHFFQNKFLLFGVFYGFVLTFAAIYVPLLNNLLGTVPLAPIYWLFVFGVGLMGITMTEIFKFVFFQMKTR